MAGTVPLAMLTRLLLFIAIFGGILGYTGARLLAWSSLPAPQAWIIWVPLVLIAIQPLIASSLRRLTRERMPWRLIIHWVSYVSLAAFGCLFFYTLVVDLSSLLWWRWVPSERIGSIQLWIVGILLFSTVVIGLIQAVRGPAVRRVDIRLPNLPSELDGFRIVQLSDLHIGATIGRRYAERCVRLANAESPDVVALTGDFVDGSVMHLRDDAKPLADLRASEGVFFITGNHEYYSGAEEWLSEFRRLGARTLLNEHVVIRRDGANLVLAGITDNSAGRFIPSHAPSPEKSVAGAPEAAIKVLLAHNPSIYKEALRAGFDLQLSGHTHGGQFFPFTLLVASVHRFYKGLYRHDDMWIYVHRGTGYWGPPIRFGVQAEIARITLRRA
jgi:predicted MPP superfamily phosphohydrolase